MTDNTITLKQIHNYKNGYYNERLKDLLKSLHKTKVDNAPISLQTIYEKSDIYFAIGCLELDRKFDKRALLFGAEAAEHKLHYFENKYPNDDRPRKAIQAKKDYANGITSIDNLMIALDDANDAVNDSVDEITNFDDFDKELLINYRRARDAAGASCRFNHYDINWEDDEIEWQKNKFLEYFGD